MEELKQLENHLEWKRSVLYALIEEREVLVRLNNEHGLSLHNSIFLLRSEIDKDRHEIEKIEEEIEEEKMKMENAIEWVNEETKMFWENEAEQIEYAVNVGMTLEEMEDLVYTHISFLAEDESLNDITREFAQVGFDKVHTDDIAKVLYIQLKETYQLA